MNLGIGLYRERRTPLHLLPAWLKVAGLIALAVSMFRLDGVVPTAIAAGAAILVLASTLPPARQTIRGVLFLAVMTAFAGVYHWFFGDPARGTEIVLTLFAIAVSALALNSSTSMDDTLGFFSSLARPVRRWMPPQGIGLMASIMLRSIPETALILTQSRDAARARGVGRSPRAVLLPSALRVVAFAIRLGDAITARGLVDESATGSPAR